MNVNNLLCIVAIILHSSSNPPLPPPTQNPSYHLYILFHFYYAYFYNNNNNVYYYFQVATALCYIIIVSSLILATQHTLLNLLHVFHLTPILLMDFSIYYHVKGLSFRLDHPIPVDERIYYYYNEITLGGILKHD